MKNKKKRLCILIWNMGVGGIQKRIRDVTIDISENCPDWEVHFLLRRKTADGFLESLSNKKNICVHMYPFPGKSIVLFSFVFWIAIMYLKIRPNVLLTFLAQLSIVAVLMRRLFFFVPTRLVLNEGVYTSAYLRLNNLSYLSGLIRKLYRQADLIIVPTQACADELVNRFDVPSLKIRVIPNWTLLSPQKHLPVKYDFIYVGRFEYEKNPWAMIDLAKYFYDRDLSRRILLVGSGRLGDQLSQKIRKLNLQKIVSILPFQSQPTELLRQSRILIVPSFNEGMPNVVLEAAVCAVPAVVRNFPGADEVVKHGQIGFIVNSNEEMISCCQKLWANEDKRAKMGASAQVFISKNFGKKRQEEYIKSIIS